jgi:SAM-dependent methyltransferase
MASLTQQEIVSRYRENYGLSATIDESHVERHRKLESELTSKLLNSTSGTRWQVFSECYTDLYRNLPWLNDYNTGKPPKKLGAWRALLKKPSTIFEVGSGKGDLLRHLAKLGHRCVATEITPERGERHVEDVEGLQWRLTDGVNLAKFEPAETYDVVVSSQVIEHFHPDDLQTHFDNARIILRTGGEYIFDTPHVGAGPHDLSKVFDLDRPVFMHLKEYDFRELGRIARSVGFKNPQAILYYQYGRLTVGPVKSHLLFQYYTLVDHALSALKLSHRQERSLRRVLRFALVPSNIWCVVQK